jgi:hypothetical protein
LFKLAFPAMTRADCPSSMMSPGFFDVGPGHALP